LEVEQQMVTSLSNMPGPLVYKIDPRFWAENASSASTCAVATDNWRLYARALSGMQKEAAVGLRPRGPAWRLVCDEGPYLQGTDLAPFPLAFFASGLAFSLLSEVRRQARRRDVELQSLKLVQDTRYSMEGSFVRGDAIGDAMPVEVALDVEAEADARTLRELVLAAVSSSPAHECMKQVLRNRFSLDFNDRTHSLSSLSEAARPEGLWPLPFDRVIRAAEDQFLPDIIVKTRTAEKKVGVPGGVGSSLSAEQKRTLHVQVAAAWQAASPIMTVDVELLKPIGSGFRLLCDDAEDGKAPPPLAYLSAGVGFCYMTQMGRYAHIKRRELSSYEIVQDNGCEYCAVDPETPGRAEARLTQFDTHVRLASDISEAEAEDILRVSERTCFLHAGLRATHPSSVQVSQSGEKISQLDAVGT
jgi:uncharacterized OsmC-like protein